MVDGIVAGAVGTLAIDAATYLDMTVRARPPSSTSQQSVAKLAEVTELDLGPEQQASNRRSGLGPLLGYGIGLTTSVAFALLTKGRRVPLPVAAVLLGAAAMVAANTPLTALGVTNPRRWSRNDWLSDIGPHLAYGLASAATWNRLSSRR
ncbi:hypothetical protein SAMN05444365_101839 [Micromonospora pattaloongensis]|uniref:DUF1440 domain-containing protein n=1 Tax=Micromonospora pattaloongensis TaxID=405436 RepID=A0A1H3HJC9_9ACTN|nr:hypothetical protein SAMN05444365_101839 [Micromonospora pattaloongensis]